MVARSVLVNGLIALVGGIGALYASAPFEHHAWRLLRHLDSGNWETVSDRPYLESIVRRSYENESDRWVLSFIAAKGSSMLLDEKHRRATVTLLGQQALADPETLQFHNIELFRAYRLFLADAISETAVKVSQQDRGLLNRLSQTLRNSRPNLKDASERAKFQSVRKVLAATPAFEELERALRAYQDYEVEFAAGPFERFQVFTDPPYDATSQWQSRSSELPSQGRCLGGARSYLADATAIDADFTVAPRLLQVTLVRPWMSEKLLDQFAAAPGLETSKYFGADGNLGFIPSRLWVLMPERVRFKGLDDSSHVTMQSWAKDNTCCQLVCESAQIRLNKDSVRLGEDKRFAAVRSDVPPLLYAIASRRRVPR